VKQGKQTFRKGEFYGFGDSGSLSIVGIRDPEKHREVRKLLSHAFSAKALRLQTDVVIQYVNIFIAQLKRLGNIPEGVVAEEVSPAK
jgi:cytochrome P450